MVTTIRARNVAEAWDLFRMHTQQEPDAFRTVSPRGLRTREFKEPVVTTYTNPTECVLLDPIRDANPFYHVYESLWLLAGRKDVQRLAFYVPSIAEFSDDGKEFFGAYGYRLRAASSVDQLREVVKLLQQDPDSRRGVLGLWRPSDWDYAATTKDLPCNTTAYVKIRDGRVHLTVCNRSNDAVWGCYGANAVQFSFLLQYLAAGLGLPVGSYHQVSDSLHVYETGPAAPTWERCRAAPVSLRGDYSYATQGLYHVPLVTNWTAFDQESERLLSPPDGTPHPGWYTEPFLRKVAYPMFAAFSMYRDGDLAGGLDYLAKELALQEQDGRQEAWLLAGCTWLQRRVK